MRLKRYAMPRWWRVARKAYPWITKPSPGPHPQESCLPLLVVLRDVLHIADKAAEVKKVIKAGKVLVDKRVVKDKGFPVGLMDVIELPDIGKAWRVVPDQRGFVLKQTKKTDTKLCRIEGKRMIRSGIIQLNLHDGRNVLVKEKKYKVGDSVIIELPGQKIVEHLQLKTGQPAFIIAGKNMGVTGKIKMIGIRKSLIEKATITLSTSAGDVQTLKDYVMVGSPEL